MQSELANGSANNSAGAYNNTNAQVGGYQSAPTSDAMSTAQGAKNTAANAQAQARSHEQVSLKNGGSAANAPGSDGSFMQSLMTDQNAANAYNANKGQQQQHPGASVYSASPSAMQRNSVDGSTPHGYGQTQGRTPTSAEMQMHQAYQLQQQQQQQMHHQQQQYQQQQQRQSRPISPNASLQEFAAQVQHFDKNALIELLWSQRNSLIQWQRRASQLEAVLNSRYQAGAPSGIPSPYYNGTPPGALAYGSGVPVNVSNEAELERAAMRRNARGQQQQQYAPHQLAGANAGSPMPSTSIGQSNSAAANPLVYWEKVRALKDAYSQELYLAHCALSQHHVSPNTAQSLKAENVKHNISLAMNVLSEAPKNVQPRPLEVLHSIERFIQNTVIPIVQRVQMSQSPHAPSPMAGQPNYQTALGSSSSGPSTSASYAPVASGQSVPPGSATPTHVATYQAQTAEAAAKDPVTENKSVAASAAAGPKGKKGKAAETGAPKMPPRAKQAPDAKVATKRLSKAAEAKLAAQQQQAPTSTAPAQQQPQQPSVRIGDGLQSPFGAGASNFEKMATPTVSPNENRTVGSSDESAKATALDAASKHAAAAATSAHGDNNNNHEDAEDDDDALNDFADFPELDFDEEMPPMKMQFNKENSAYNTKKRSIGDV